MYVSSKLYLFTNVLLQYPLMQLKKLDLAVGEELMVSIKTVNLCYYIPITCYPKKE